jgi:hypothetical protein
MDGEVLLSGAHGQGQAVRQARSHGLVGTSWGKDVSLRDHCVDHGRAHRQSSRPEPRWHRHPPAVARDLVFRFYVLDPSADDPESSEELAHRLERESTTFIAESSFGWGEER